MMGTCKPHPNPWALITCVAVWTVVRPGAGGGRLGAAVEGPSLPPCHTLRAGVGVQSAMLETWDPKCCLRSQKPSLPPPLLLDRQAADGRLHKGLQGLSVMFAAVVL